jgi:tRNA wybutosine-synthesizing protein 1
LIGEPTLYPKLPELVKELRKRKKTSFVVTNGLSPGMLKKLNKESAFPTQIYISLNSPDEKNFRKWHNSKEKNAWKKFNQSLSIFKKINTRTVIRMTLVKDLNMKKEFIKDYSKLILKAEPDFIEVKGFISVGFARKRLGYERMPSHSEIKEFSLKLLNFLPEYRFLDEQKESKVVLLGKNKRKMKIKKSEI